MEGKLFGLPMWAALLALGGAGILGYVIFFRNRATPGGGTTGYSPQALAVMQNPDESATMALQNQALSQLGVQTENNYVAITNQVAQAHTDLSDAMRVYNVGLSQQLGDTATMLREQAAQSNQQLNQVLGSSVSLLSGQEHTSEQQNAAYYQGVLTNLENYLTALRNGTPFGQVSPPTLSSSASGQLP